ncbi:MAG: SDR family oxidoreductase [Burkholderiaceae bacterium]
MTDLHGKKAFVTGASRGIGAATAIGLARQGADVAITYQSSKEKAEAVAAEIIRLGRRALVLQVDAADVQAVQRAVGEAARVFGRIDILVANAGIARMAPIDEAPLQDHIDQVAVNITGVVAAVKAVLPHMGAGGRIISTGSCLAERVHGPGMSFYSLTKSALIGFTKGIARDLGPRGITANLVHPGPIDTDMNPADGPDAAGQVAQLALGHYGKPHDVAAAVVFLASEEARYITGTGLAVDGGYCA